jgi:hypothetical protein
MGKRASVILIVMPAALFGLLVFLSRTSSVRGSGLGGQVFSLPGAPLLQGALESEPNDTLETADPLEVNLTIRGAITVGNKSDLDWYRLTLPAADVGRDYRASLEELDPDPDYKLELNLYDAEGDLIDSQSAGSTTALDWTSSVITYYLRVRASDYSEAVKDADYHLTVVRFDEPTPTATTVPWDQCEPNDSFDETCSLSVGVTKTGLNFRHWRDRSDPNDDYFTFLAKAGRTYGVTTDVAGGADTEMWLYNSSGEQLAYDDDGGDGYGSRITHRAATDDLYRVLVRDHAGSTSPPTTQTYDILVEDVTPVTNTPTSTPAPGTVTATPPPSIPGVPDGYEPNYWFDRAALIGLDQEVKANFVPSLGAGPDTDFYKLWVVAGKVYTCETFNLGTATNTNMILCSGPSREQCFAGNDDALPFDPADPYRSRLPFFSSYNGYLYLMLGQVGAEQILPEEWKNLSYSLRCYIEQPGTATPTPTSEFAPTAPRPTSTPALDTLLPSATRAQLVVRPMSTPAPPPPASPATPTPGLTVIELSLYYDQNQNGQVDLGEGIASVLARAYDALSGELLSIDYTDETGHLRFAVPASGPVRVSVPFFGFNQVVTATNTAIQIRISPRP